MKAILFATWAVAWFAAYSVVVVILFDLWHSTMPTCLKTMPVVFVAAWIGWLVAHRGGRELSTRGFMLLVFGVVVPSHFFFTAMQFAPWPSPWWDSLRPYVLVSFVAFLAHCWITLPIAVIATRLFLRWSDR